MRLKGRVIVSWEDSQERKFPPQTSLVTFHSHTHYTSLSFFLFVCNCLFRVQLGKPCHRLRQNTEEEASGSFCPMAAKLRAAVWRERKRQREHDLSGIACTNRLQITTHTHTHTRFRKAIYLWKTGVEFVFYTGPKQTVQQCTIYFRKKFPETVPHTYHSHY